MKTTIDLDERRLSAVMKLTGLKTRKAAVDYEPSKDPLSGAAGRVLRSILTEAQKDESIRKDREAAAKVDRRAICGDAPRPRKRSPHA